MIEVMEKFNYPRNDVYNDIKGYVKMTAKEQINYTPIEGEDGIVQIFSERNDNTEVDTMSLNTGTELITYVMCGESLSDSEVDKFNECKTILDMALLAEKNGGCVAVCFG